MTGKAQGNRRGGGGLWQSVLDNKWLNPPRNKSLLGGNKQRKNSDFLWLGVFFAVLWIYGKRWTTSSVEEANEFLVTLNFVGFPIEDTWKIYLGFYLLTVVSLASITTGLWFLMKWIHPKTPTMHLKTQMEAISVNFLLLPLMQVLSDYAAVNGLTKQTTGNLTPWLMFRDACMWMVMFELSWYTQHRAMHTKLLWKLGHEYHHTWRKPEHMIGVTNFAFDHIVEVFVTMSSALIPTLYFPINFQLNKILGLAYMLLAVLVHWDHFPYKFHLNHHYLVAVNYGSHWPFLDMFFGTYQWDDFEPKDRFE